MELSLLDRPARGDDGDSEGDAPRHPLNDSNGPSGSRRRGAEALYWTHNPGLTWAQDDGIVVCGEVGCHSHGVDVDTLVVPAPVRERLGDAGSDGLVMMFAEAHRIGTEQLDRRMAEVSASFDRKLADEISKFRVEMVERMSDLRFDLMKWNFLFWIGQIAAITGILSVMLRDLR